MKKFLYTLAFVLCATSAMAETIIVIDDNGVVKQQMTTNTATTIIQPTVVTAQPQVTVVRETPQVTNSYYYDSYSTGSAIVAGVTTAVVGALLFDGFKIGHHHHRKSAPAVIHHNPGHPSAHKHKR